MRWFIDFDDTLAIGPMTWALNHVVPSMIEEHKLPYDADLFLEQTLRAQQEANLGLGDDAVLDYIIKQHTIPADETYTIVGDDPWSDGSFADTCQINCWILDRLDRYARLYPGKTYRWVRSLDEITISVEAQ